MTPTTRHRRLGANLAANTAANLRRRLGVNLSRRLADGADAGMATAEYALVTVAAAGFAGLLLVILKGGEVQALLLGIITRALG